MADSRDGGVRFLVGVQLGGAIGLALGLVSPPPAMAATPGA